MGIDERPLKCKSYQNHHVIYSSHEVSGQSSKVMSISADRRYLASSIHSKQASPQRRTMSKSSSLIHEKLNVIGIIIVGLTHPEISSRCNSKELQMGQRRAFPMEAALRNGTELSSPSICSGISSPPEGKSGHHRTRRNFPETTWKSRSVEYLESNPCTREASHSATMKTEIILIRIS